VRLLQGQQQVAGRAYGRVGVPPPGRSPYRRQRWPRARAMSRPRSRGRPWLSPGGSEHIRSSYHDPPSPGGSAPNTWVVGTASSRSACSEARRSRPHMGRRPAASPCSSPRADVDEPSTHHDHWKIYSHASAPQTWRASHRCRSGRRCPGRWVAVRHSADAHDERGGRARRCSTAATAAARSVSGTSRS
jgi:hypothetical protein